MSFFDQYEPVEDRLRQFWEEHPYGRVITELLHHADGEYIVLASVYYGNELRNDPPTATGLAHDSTSSLPNNMKSSALEVCETSAIGRALANAGYAPKGKRPSREEMQKSAPGLGALHSTGAERPEGKGNGEGPDPSGELSDTGPVVDAGDGEGDAVSRGPANSLSPSEPHDHVKGKQLASGKFLCIWEDANGKVCGEPFKPKPTVFTAPVQERTDLA